MMQLKLIPLFVFCFISAGNAQHELGNVTVAELEQKFYPQDSSASAAILFKIGESHVNTTEVKTRIKIYKKEGYQWANQQVLHFANQYVTYSDAVTYNIEGGKIIKTKLNRDGIFEEKINKDIGSSKMSMPNVKLGSIIEFKYIVKSVGIGTPEKWNFQSTIPVSYSEFKTFIPEYLVFNTTQKGSIFPRIAIQKQQRDGYEETITTYLAENLPAMKEEAYVNNIDNYTSGITHGLSIVKGPIFQPKQFASDWQTVVKTIYGFEGFGAELSKKGYFEKDIDSLVLTVKTRRETINAIFNYVKSKVKWNKYTGFTCHEGVKSAYKQRLGDAAEINLMLTAMLRYAGLDANPVLLSTREHGIAIFPNINAYNFVIVAIEIQNEFLFLDATEKYSLPGILPLRNLNWRGRLIRNEGNSVELDLTPKFNSKEINFITVKIGTDGVVSGKIKRQFTDYEALAFRVKNSDKSQETNLEELENSYRSIQVDGYSADSFSDITKPVTEIYSFTDSKNSEVIGNAIYFPPLGFLRPTENPFKQEKREYPVDFGFPFQKKYNVNIEIPDGYTVESMPATMNIETGEGIAAFKYVIGKTESNIQVTITQDINIAIVSAEAYDVLKDFFQRMIDKQNEKIVFKKI